MKNLIVGQSGGPTAVINCSLAGVVNAALKCGKIDKVWGAVNGISGVINGNFTDLSRFKDEKLLKILKQTPSSYLGSCRKKLPEYSEDGKIYEDIFEAFRKMNAGYFLYIGGNDSMDTVKKLSGYAAANRIDMKIIGIPKTIDNDLMLTDHTPGFGSAAKFIANGIRQLSLDADVYDMKSVLLVEIMGRNAGWLTAAAALANSGQMKAADLICLPEKTFDTEHFLSCTEKILKEKNTVIAAVSEGIKDKNGHYIGENVSKRSAEADNFQHAVLGGAGRVLEAEIRDSLGVKVRTVELNTLQRCFAQGASRCDSEEAFGAGEAAVRFALEGRTAVMAGFERSSDEPYRIETVPYDINSVANYEKKVPDEMIGGDFAVTDKYISYAAPLICGENEIIYENGLISLAKRF